jgi:membrane dipeptidase
LISRRRFLEQASMAASAAILPRSLPARSLRVPAAFADEPAVDAKLLERAKTLLRQAPFIDTHNDLPTMLIDAKAGDMTQWDLSKVQTALCADIPRLREGCIGAQYWSVYVDSGTQKTHTSLHEAVREFDVALRMIRSQEDFEQARTADDIERIHRTGHIACLLGVEGGHMIENSSAALRVFYELGARYMTLTHWDNIDWADAATDRPLNFGLTEFGKRIVREMNRLGMFADIAHVSADTMRDTLSVSRAPVIASHSDAFAIAPHPRCMPDDVLARIPANGGVVHVSFIGPFVAPKYMEWNARQTKALEELHGRLDTDDAIKKGIAEWEKQNPEPRATIADVADHIDHIRKVAGIDSIGIGADFYQNKPDSMADGLGDVSRYPYLFAELLRRGYSDEDVLKIAGRNHLRAMRQMEKVAADLQKTEAPFIG